MDSLQPTRRTAYLARVFTSLLHDINNVRIHCSAHN